MDVYSEVVRPEPAELINSPFGGRYCGPIPPRRRVSLYRAVALAFYTDKNASTADLFTGRFTFINDCKWYNLIRKMLLLTERLIVSVCSGISSGRSGGQHAVQLPRERLGEAQRVAVVADLPGRLPQGARLQLPVPRQRKPEDPIGIQRLWSLLRRTALSVWLRARLRRRWQHVGHRWHLLRPAAQLGAVLVPFVAAGYICHPPTHCQYSEQGIQRHLRVRQFFYQVRWVHNDCLMLFQIRFTLQNFASVFPLLCVVNNFCNML